MFWWIMTILLFCVVVVSPLFRKIYKNKKKKNLN